MMMKHGIGVHQLHILYFVPEEEILQEIECNHVITVLSYTMQTQ